MFDPRKEAERLAREIYAAQFGPLAAAADCVGHVSRWPSLAKLVVEETSAALSRVRRAAIEEVAEKVKEIRRQADEVGSHFYDGDKYWPAKWRELLHALAEAEKSVEGEK